MRTVRSNQSQSTLASGSLNVTLERGFTRIAVLPGNDRALATVQATLATSLRSRSTQAGRVLVVHTKLMRGSDSARWSRAFSRTDLASASAIQRSPTSFPIATSTFVVSAKLV
jgi:hypothetical protein